MQLFSLIQGYLESPIPIWNLEIANTLSEKKIQKLGEFVTSEKKYGYSTAQSLLGCDSIDISNGSIKMTDLVIEYPDFANLSHFYDTHGLDMLPITKFEELKVINQITSATELLKKDLQLCRFLSSIVRAIQILRQPEPEFDVSYSHPSVSFTVFVSVGERKSDIDTLRLSESILHESMHLFLTLIEEVVPLVFDNSKTYHSPWRETDRPIGGVLHGVFVFSAIKKWYIDVVKSSFCAESVDFARWRIEAINKEIDHLKSFPSSKGLTTLGAKFASSLINES